MSDVLKAIAYGIIEGITEWLPISSTGHLLLVMQWLKMDVSDAFMEMFSIVIQFGAILAVVGTYNNALNPFAKQKSKKERQSVFRLWLLFCIAVLPSAFVGILLDGWCNQYLDNTPTIAVALIFFGILFIIIEHYHKAEDAVDNYEQLSYPKALGIGLFQMLSVIPGTSRSGVTMIGAMSLGASRSLATQFSFYMAIPTMVGYSLLKLLKFIMLGNVLMPKEMLILAIAFFVAFLVSLLTMKWLLSFVRRHSFLPFGVYRILLGTFLLLLYFKNSL